MPTKAKEQTSPKDVTSASSWKSKRVEGMIIELPSGNVARLKRTMSLMTLIKTGQIPNPLAKHVDEMIKAGGRGLDLKNMDQVTIGQMLTMVNEQMEHIFVEPKVVALPEGENPAEWQPDEEGAISIEDLDMDDRFFAFSFAQGGPADVATFRLSQATMATVENGTVLQLPSEQPGDGTS